MPIASQLPDVVLKDQPLHQLMLDAINYHDPKSIAIIESGAGKPMTFGDLFQHIDALSQGLYRAGLRNGDIVVLCLPNCIEYVVITLSVLQCGGVISGMDHAFTEDEMANRLQRCQCLYVFTTSSIAKIVVQASEKAGGFIQKIFLVDSQASDKVSSNSTMQIQYLHELFLVSKNGSTQLGDTKIWTKTDLAVLSFNCGGKENPKGIMLSHYNVAAAVQLRSHRFFLQPTKSDKVIALQPFFDLEGFLLMLHSLFMGCTMIAMPNLEVENVYSIVQNYKICTMYLNLSVLISLIKDHPLKKYDTTSVTQLIIRGSIGKLLSEIILEHFPNVKYFIRAYGPPECCLVSHTSPPVRETEFKYGNCGALMPNMECKIVDTKSGNELDPNKFGELYIRTPTRMLGYWNEPNATDKVIKQENWFRTGDLAFYDEDEIFYVVDKTSDTTTVATLEVFPSELESIFSIHPRVEEVLVTPVQNSKFGTVLKAYIVPSKMGPNLTANELKIYLKDKINLDEQVKGGLHMVDKIPSDCRFQAVISTDKINAKL